MSDRVQPGVIWVSGFSSAGKSTVGRAVVAKLKERGGSAVFLDGDILRSIFKRKWGFSRDERLELAVVYFQLSSYLSSQGITVVTAAIALYEETRSWIKENIPNSLEVFLSVPEGERLARDAKTKGVYGTFKATEDPGYLPPAANGSALIIDNGDGIDPIQVAENIVGKYLEKQDASSSYGKITHWRQYYAHKKGVFTPSQFAADMMRSQLILPPCRLLEVGCGNGRDAIYFAASGCAVIAIDASESAIELCKSCHGASGVTFCAGTIDRVDAIVGRDFDVIYSRFVMHAMTYTEESEFLKKTHSHLSVGGRLLIECRSINDPMALVGEAISPTERIHGHYRRFIVLSELLTSLEANGFHVENAIESKGLAVLGDQDPVVLRVVGRKM